MATRKEDASEQWYMRPVEEVFKNFGTSVDGLSDEEARLRLKNTGPNKLAEEEKPPILDTILHQFKSPLIYILLIAGAIAFIIGDLIDGLVIYAVLALNAVIGFTQEYKAAEAIRALARMLALKATVVRDGFERELNSELIVPGDIVLLRSGQKIPADIRLIQVKELQVDESAFTGESVPVFKETDPLAQADLPPFEQRNMVFMGGIVASGRATGLVVATGKNTQLGRISEEVRAIGEIKTPLQLRIEALSRYIVFATSGFGAAGFGIGVLRQENISALILAIVAMAVAAVPEGLPIVLTIVLAVAVNRMARNNAIIRYLPAIETIGSSTVIGSDKTGTLTKNEMTVQRIWAGGDAYRIEGAGYDPAGRILYNSEPVESKSHPLLEWVLRIGLLANESNLVEENGRWEAHGDPTEVALIVSSCRGGMDEERERNGYPQLDVLPFESEAQYMATLNKHGDTVYLLVKGAPEKILALSKRIARAQDGIEIHKATVTQTANEFADEGLRVLGMAYKEMSPGTDEITHEDVNGLTFVGLQGMMDPPRPEAVEAVATARLSGIRVIMITGDNARTAMSVSKMMGIADQDNGEVATGRDLDRIDDTELKEIVRSTSVFARVLPPS